MIQSEAGSDVVFHLTKAFDVVVMTQIRPARSPLVSASQPAHTRTHVDCDALRQGPVSRGKH